MLFWLTDCPDLQQLYIYGGLLIVYASINAFPLKTVARLAKFGAWWLVAGSDPHLSHVLSCCMLRMPLLHDLALSVWLDCQAALYA